MVVFYSNLIFNVPETAVGRLACTAGVQNSRAAQERAYEESRSDGRLTDKDQPGELGKGTAWELLAAAEDAVQRTASVSQELQNNSFMNDE